MNEYRDNFQSVTASLASQIQSLEIKIDKLSSSLHEDSIQLKVKNPIAKKLLIILAALIVVQILFFAGYHYTSYKTMFGISMSMNSLFIVITFICWGGSWINNE